MNTVLLWNFHTEGETCDDVRALLQAVPQRNVNMSDFHFRLST
jgi:hypothetical protein